jgi:polyketide cyclase/dehydrase/lipid transport protein
MALPEHTVARSLPVPVELAFDVVVAEDVLPHVLHRWGPIPAVTGTRDLTGPWDTPGSERTVVLGDGNTARERVLVWERPSRFSYEVGRITGAFGSLVDHAVGEWRFEASGGGSSFVWTYTFHPCRAWARPLLAVAARTAWARYMEQCADLCVERAKSAAAG